MSDDISSESRADALIARYYAGDCGATERAEAEARIAADPAERRFAEAAGRALRSDVAAWGDPDLQRAMAAWRRHAGQAAGQHASQSASHTPVRTASSVSAPASRTRVTSRRWTWTAAAGVAVAAILLLATVTSGNLRARFEQHSTVTRTYATGHAQRMSVDLPDGTRVQLAPATRLEYRASTSGARDVLLDGQAYFTVDHDARRPFTVHTGAVATRVLGTAFDVRHYADDADVQVTVTDGKVASQGRRSTVILTPGMRGRITDSSSIAEAVRDNSATAWTRGQLVFTDVPLATVLRSLERWYGYTFYADSTLRTQRVTMIVSVDNPSKALGALKQLLDVTLTFTGDTITMRPAPRTGVTTPTRRQPRQTISLSHEVGR